MRVLVEAYGCSLNRGECEELVDELVERGHSITTKEEGTDLVVIFTCGVIETTERRMLKRIGHFARSGKELAVCGCLGDISPDKIMAVAPKARVYPVTRHAGVLNYLDAPTRGPGVTRLLDEGSVGILPISSGCGGSCSYCVTRLARGELKSRPLVELVARARELIERGAVEIQICAQDTATYGVDLDTTLDPLISSLVKLDGDFMLRIGMMNPENALRFLPMVMDAYQHDKVFKFLHLPVQSGSDGVLNRMERRYTVADFLELVDAFRARFPDGVLSTDIIVGFPGETDEEFAGSVELLNLVKPDIVNVTRFSARPGTEAEKMNGQIPGRIAKDRSRFIAELRFAVSEGRYEHMIGKRMKAVATERRVTGTTFLRTVNYRPVVVEEDLELSKWYEVEVTGYTKTHLVGRVVD